MLSKEACLPSTCLGSSTFCLEAVHFHNKMLGSLYVEVSQRVKTTRIIFFLLFSLFSRLDGRCWFMQGMFSMLCAEMCAENPFCKYRNWFHEHRLYLLNWFCV